MSVENFSATFVDGVFRPDEPVNIPAGSRVQLQVSALNVPTSAADALAELDAICRDFSIDSKGDFLTRDQLNERS